MVMRVYSPEFKADAVALYLSDPSHTCTQIGDDLGVSRETLRNWVSARRFPGAAACRRQVFRWLTRYNTRRRHSANGQLSPVAREQEYELQSDTMTLAA